MELKKEWKFSEIKKQYGQGDNGPMEIPLVRICSIDCANGSHIGPFVTERRSSSLTDLEAGTR